MPQTTPIPVIIHVGKRELLDSGVVHMEGLETVVVKVAGLQFHFSFKSDEGAVRYTGKLEDGILYFELFNHKNSLGEGKFEPIEVAQVQGRPLSLTYFVNTLNNDANARRFEYAIYLGEPK